MSYDELLGYLNHPPQTVLPGRGPGVLAKVPIQTGAGVPWSVPTARDLLDRIAVFDTQVRIRFALEAVLPLLQPENEDLRAQLGWVTYALDGYQTSRLQMRMTLGSLRQARRDPRVRLHQSVGELCDAIVLTMEPPLLPGDDSRIAEHCRDAILHAAVAWSGTSETETRYDAFMEWWWRRCMAILPVSGVLTTRIEWRGADLLERLQAEAKVVSEED